MSLQDAISSLRKGNFILLHDGSTRENEVDMVVAADFVTAEHVARMRQDVGGLIYLSKNHTVGASLGLIYTHDIHFHFHKIDIHANGVLIGSPHYGARPPIFI